MNNDAIVTTAETLNDDVLELVSVYTGRLDIAHIEKELLYDLIRILMEENSYLRGHAGQLPPGPSAMELARRTLQEVAHGR